jgi:hypothetical protein
MMTDLRDMKRWIVLNYASKLISPLALTVTPIIGHPLLANDSTVVRFNLYDKPSYGGGSYASHERYCAIINKLIIKAITGNDPSYNHRSVGIFTSDNSRILSETLFQCFLCDLYVWIKTGVIDRNEMNIALGTKLIPIIRSQHDEKHRVNLILRAASNIAKLIQNEHPGAASIARRLGRGRVIGYKATIPDMLKSTRDTDKWGLVLPTRVVRKQLKLSSGSLPPGDKWIPQTCATSITGTRILEASRSTPDKILEEVYYRNVGRVGYFSGTVIYTWSVFSDLLARKPLLVIGSGMGAAARVTIDNGCPHVFGLDMRQSLPMKSHRFISYKPPLVLGSEYSERYTQMSESFTTSGDWMEPKVVNAVMNYDAGDSTLLIDIQDSKNRFGLEVLTNVIKVKRSGVIILRSYLATDEHIAACSDLSASGVEFKSYTLESTGISAPVVFVLLRWPDQLLINLHPAGDLSRRPIPLRYTDEANQFERVSAMSDALLNVYLPSASDSPEVIRDQIELLIKESKGDYDSRFAYSQWTRMLRAYTSAVFMCIDPDRQLATLLDWHFAGHVDHQCDEKLHVRVDWSLCYHLASVVSKIQRIS